MDCIMTGKLIKNLRKEYGLTQKQLADKMNISDKTVSKWERGGGCPDVSLLGELSEILGVNIKEILSGNLSENDKENGNMKKTKFYVCPSCGNITMSAGEPEISCCGRKLAALEVKKSDEAHKLDISEVEGDFYITFNHEMKKEHYIRFIAYAACDRALITRLYPEQGAEVRFPKMYGGKLYICCSRHNLWEVDVPKKI